MDEQLKLAVANIELKTIRIAELETEVNSRKNEGERWTELEKHFRAQIDELMNQNQRQRTEIEEINRSMMSQARDFEDKMLNIQDELAQERESNRTSASKAQHLLQMKVQT